MPRDHYAEHPPPPAAAGLDCVWSRTVSADAPVRRIVPDGCVDVIFCDGALWIAGPDTREHLSTAHGELIGARFTPGTAGAALGLPVRLLRDSRVDLADVWAPGRARGLAERLAEADPRRAGYVLAGELLPVPEPDPAIPMIRALAARQRPIAEIAAAVGLGDRQLHRRCQDAFGYGPKTLIRVLRFQRALARARAGVPLAQVAYDCGYADQAHLAREVKSLSGTTLRALRGPRQTPERAHDLSGR